MTAVLLCLALAGALEDDDAYGEAVQAYQQLELDAALAAFTALSQQPWDNAEAATLQAWIGLTLVQASRTDEARAAFLRAIALDDGVALPAPASSKVKRLFDSARADAQRQQRLDMAHNDEDMAPMADDDEAHEQGRGRDRLQEPAPAEPHAASTAGPDAPPLALLAGVGAAAALVTTVVAGAVTGVHYSKAVDPNTPQVEAARLTGDANVALAVACASGALSVLLGSLTAALWWSDAAPGANGADP